MTVFTFVLELAGKKRRGLFIGLVNTAFTSGVALGAVIAGALLPVAGWVSVYLDRDQIHCLTMRSEIHISQPVPFGVTGWDRHPA